MENYGRTNFSLTVPRVYGHAAGWWVGGHLAQPVKAGSSIVSGCTFQGNGGLCPVIAVAPMSTSTWVDVGAQMDTLTHGSWNLNGVFHNWTSEFSNGA